MSETLSKIALYLRPGKRYWHAVSDPQRLADPLAYPIDFGPRLHDGHFHHFDDAGVPLRITRAGALHNYTRICGWALAHWSTRHSGVFPQSHADAFLTAADYILDTAIRSGSEIQLRAEVLGAGHIGPISAMSQGQAMSVLVRAHILTGETRYLDGAAACLGPFRRSVSQDGVVGSMAGVHHPWFEEDTREPSRHILNGMVFALWGLHDLGYHQDHVEAGELYDAGILALAAAIDRYDTGRWSTYDAPDEMRPYIASMRYHDLHIAQLEALAVHHAEFRAYADRFRAHAQSVGRRWYAAGTMALAKIRGDFRHDGA